MRLNAVRLVYFSPTKTTQTILESIADGMQSLSVSRTDLTPPGAVAGIEPVSPGELVMIGAPVYGGRLPATAVERFRNIKGNGALAGVVVVYGNRAYEDALLELRDLALELDFRPIAGAAFIGEHSFADEKTIIANGRPDDRDRSQAGQFGAAIIQKAASLDHSKSASTLQVPGKHPYKQFAKIENVCPDTNQDTCIGCQACVSVCPTAAVRMETKIESVPERCILCCACVKQCPTGARVMAVSAVRKIASWLSENFRAPKEPEIFM